MLLGDGLEVGSLLTFQYSSVLRVGGAVEQIIYRVVHIVDMKLSVRRLNVPGICSTYSMTSRLVASFAS